MYMLDNGRAGKQCSIGGLILSMNKYPRFLALAVAVFFALLMVFGIFGIHTEYGDIKTSIAYGVEESSTGTGLGGELMVTYLCPGGSEISDSDIRAISSILEKRLEAYGMRDSRVYFDEELKIFAVEASYTGRSTYNPNILYQYLGHIGKVEIRAGNEKDDDGHPAGITAEKVLASSEDMKKVTFSIDDSSSSTRYLCDITFSGDSKKTLREHTESVINSETSSDKYYSIWLDGEMVTSRAFNSVIKDGVVPSGTIVTSSGSDVLNDYIAIRMYSESGMLPFQLTGAYVYNLSEPDNGTLFTGALFILLAVAAAVSALCFIRYGFGGIGVAVGMVGFCGAICIILSGSLSTDFGMYVSKNVLYSLIASVAAVSLMIVSVLSRFSSELRRLTAFRAAKDVFSAAEKRGAFALIALAVVTIALRLLYGVFRFLYAPYEVMMAFTVFCAAGYVTVLLGTACVVKAFASAKQLTNEKLYGGFAK